MSPGSLPRGNLLRIGKRSPMDSMMSPVMIRIFCIAEGNETGKKNPPSVLICCYLMDWANLVLFEFDLAWGLRPILVTQLQAFVLYRTTYPCGLSIKLSKCMYFSENCFNPCHFEVLRCLPGPEVNSWSASSWSDLFSNHSNNTLIYCFLNCIFDHHLLFVAKTNQKVNREKLFSIKFR